MKIKTWIKYKEAGKEKEDYINVSLNEVGLEKLTLAFEDNSFQGKGKIYSYKGKLWSKVKHGSIISDPVEHGLKTTLDELVYRNLKCSTYFDFAQKRDAVIKKAMADIPFILVNNILYEETAEPRYCVVSFGLGYNYGGIGMFVTYNDDCFHGKHFSAFDGRNAVDYANKLAASYKGIKEQEEFSEKIIAYSQNL